MNGEQILHQDWVERFQQFSTCLKPKTTTVDGIIDDVTISSDVDDVDAARRCSCCRNEVLRRSIP